MVDVLPHLTRLKGMSSYRKQAGISESASVTQFSFTDSVLHSCCLKSHPAWACFSLGFVLFGFVCVFCFVFLPF